MTKRRLVVISLLLLAICCSGLVWAAWQQRQNRLYIENRSGQSIAWLNITIAKETIEFKNIPAGGKVTSTFQIITDDHFVVQGQLVDGTKIGGEFGYVTGGMEPEEAFFIIRRDGKIDFRQTNNIGY